jgi:serine/threonine protein kinase
MKLDSATGNVCPGCFAAPAADGPCPGCGFDVRAPRPPNALPLGTELDGQFIVGRVLGSPGGFGITYLGFDTRLETPVAIKEYLPRDLATRADDGLSIVSHDATDAEPYRYGLTRFLDEARTLAKLDHPNIFRVRQFFEANGSAYLVMDYLEGLTLAEYLDRQPGGRIPEDKALALLRPILDGLRAIHAKGFLHRDVKPANIYLARTDGGGVRPTLLDFGAARQALGEQTRALSVVLTEHYAPFEQYHRKGRQGPWTDVYAAAATLYRMVTGNVPPTAPARLAEDELTPPAALGCSQRLSAAIMAGLTLDAQARPQSVDAFLALLEPVTSPIPPPGGDTDQPTTAAPGAPIDPAPPRQRQALVVGLGLLTALLAGSTLTLLALRHLDHDRAVPGSAAAGAADVGLSRSAPDAAPRRAPAPPAAGAAQPPAAEPPGFSGAVPPVDSLPPAPARIPADAGAAPSLSGPPQPGVGAPYIVRPNGSGFTAVRSAASKDSTEVTRLYPGDRATCGAVIAGQWLDYGNRWLRCSRPRGYVYASLLVPELNGTEARRFVVRGTSDGFVAVRSRPTTEAGSRVDKLHKGQIVHCNRLVEGEPFDYGPYWLHCPAAGGYIYAQLLIPD